MPKFYRVLSLLSLSLIVVLFQNCGKPKNVLEGSADQASLDLLTSPDMWVTDPSLSDNKLLAQNAVDFGGSGTQPLMIYPTVGSFYMSELSVPQQVPYYEFYGTLKSPISLISACRLDPLIQDEFKLSIRCPGTLGDVAACDALVLDQNLSLANPPAGVTISLQMGIYHTATSGTVHVKSFIRKPLLSSNFYFDSGKYEVTMSQVNFVTYTPGKLPATLPFYQAQHWGQSLIDGSIQVNVPGCGK